MSPPVVSWLIAIAVSIPAPLALAEEKNPDPWEGLNRKVQKFNDAADRRLLKPIAKGYTKVVPRVLRRGVSNFFSNLTYPVVVVNQLLQGKLREGASDTGRFLFNSIVGIGGLFDPATRVGIARHEEDFGQTLGKWGIYSGPYVVVPFLGPRTIRDGAGSFADSYMFAPRYAEDETVRYGLTGLYFLDGRAALLDVEELISGDRYAFMRDAYLQRREYLVHDGDLEDAFLEDDWED